MKNNGIVEPLSDEEQALLCIFGASQFDPKLVAKLLRSGPISVLARHGLANMIDNTHPMGVKLVWVRPDKNWQSIQQGSESWRLLNAIGEYYSALREKQGWEPSINDTAEHFGVSESTVSRNLRLYKYIQHIENE